MKYWSRTNEFKKSYCFRKTCTMTLFLKNWTVKSFGKREREREESRYTFWKRYLHFSHRKNFEFYSFCYLSQLFFNNKGHFFNSVTFYRNFPTKKILEENYQNSFLVPKKHCEINVHNFILRIKGYF